jgi:hypothetical protein
MVQSETIHTKKNRSKFTKLQNLMIESREHFKHIHQCKKLVRRFWNCLTAYKNGATYCYIMTNIVIFDRQEHITHQNCK